MKEESNYEKEKQIKKQKLVRNEFLYNNDCCGKYDFPIIKKQNIDVDKINFLSFVNTKKNDIENKDKTIHFFTYDWFFEKVYENAEEEFEKLKQYKYLLSPDFSIFTNMPKALQIENVFKNRWCGSFWQSKGLKVIPTISWGDKNSFDFCFDGIEKGSIVAVCTYYRENCEEEFMLGYNEMLKRIKPSLVICYDEPFKSMSGNIKEFLPTTYEFTKNLSWQDLVQFKWEKHNKNICGLNEKNFKFFKYKDDYNKNILKKCDVCGKFVLVDQFGNGTCENCSWEQGGSDLEEKNHVGYPNVITLSFAKKLYKQGLPFKPDFENFVNGLMFYGEMQFYYNGDKYLVFRYTDKFEIEMYKEKEYESKQVFLTKQDFIDKASINKKLLKDIWQDVKNADYMSCE